MADCSGLFANCLFAYCLLPVAYLPFAYCQLPVCQLVRAPFPGSCLHSFIKITGQDLIWVAQLNFGVFDCWPVCQQTTPAFLQDSKWQYMESDRTYVPWHADTPLGSHGLTDLEADR